MTNLIYYVFYAFLIASFSFTYIYVLLDADMLLGGFYRIVSPIMDKTLITRWLKKPLLDCVYCNSGQIALWFYLIRYWNYNYDLFLHIGFIGLTIMIVHILKKKYANN